LQECGKTPKRQQHPIRSPAIIDDCPGLGVAGSLHVSFVPVVLQKSQKCVATNFPLKDETIDNRPD
jgi:hypothetical protein